MIRDAGTRQGGIKTPQLAEAILRHHPPGFQIGRSGNSNQSDARKERCHSGARQIPEHEYRRARPRVLFRHLRSLQSDSLTVIVLFHLGRTLTIARSIHRAPQRGFSVPNSAWYCAFEN
jgi:hypothetical protein